MAVVGAAGVAVAGDQVPFGGSLNGTATVSPRFGDPDFDVHVEVDGGGNATHLGQFTASIPHNVDRRVPPPSFAAGEYVFTAANGDLLCAVFEGFSFPIGGGVLYIEEEATIIGGTGRFAGASGSFTCQRWFDTIAGTTNGSFDGTISSPGSNK